MIGLFTWVRFHLILCRNCCYKDGVMESSWNQEMKHTKATLSDRQDTVRGAVFTSAFNPETGCWCLNSMRGWTTWGITVRTCQDFTGIIPNLFTACHHLALFSHVHLYTYHWSRNIYPHISIYLQYHIVSLIHIVFGWHIFHILVNFTRTHQDESKRKSAAFELTTAQVRPAPRRDLFFAEKNGAVDLHVLKQDIMIMIYIYIYICNRCKL